MPIPIAELARMREAHPDMTEMQIRQMWKGADQMQKKASQNGHTLTPAAKLAEPVPATAERDALSFAEVMGVLDSLGLGNAPETRSEGAVGHVSAYAETLSADVEIVGRAIHVKIRARGFSLTKWAGTLDDEPEPDTEGDSGYDFS